MPGRARQRRRVGEAFKARYGNFGMCVSRRTHDERSERREAARNAAQTCRHERGDTPDEHAAFRVRYATNGCERNAFGRCVSQHARAEMQQEDTEDAEERAARRNAARACDEERGETDGSRAAFRKRYGTNSDGDNALGRCVSQSAARAQLEGGSSGV